MHIYSIDEVFIDMGLPSGVKWAKCNLDVTQASKMAKSAFQYDCSFFSWGNVDGHNPTSASSFSPYSWGSINAEAPWYDGQVYGSTPGAALTNSFAADSGYDAVRENLGSPYRMPNNASAIRRKAWPTVRDMEAGVPKGSHRARDCRSKRPTPYQADARSLDELFHRPRAFVYRRSVRFYFWTLSDSADLPTALNASTAQTYSCRASSERTCASHAPLTINDMCILSREGP